MKLASYKTAAGAERYAAEIRAKFPSVKAAPAVKSDFRWGVYVTTPDGRGAYAMKRPAHYGNYGARKTYTVPNDGGL